jgi:hypothetical protein
LRQRLVYGVNPGGELRQRGRIGGTPLPEHKAQKNQVQHHQKSEQCDNHRLPSLQAQQQRSPGTPLDSRSNEL